MATQKRLAPRYWNCPFCGTFNPAGYEYCSRCEGPKPEKWLCSKCEFPNEVKDEKCFICGQVREA